jgi:hypothetical protein
MNKWLPETFLNYSNICNVTKFALIVLNRPIIVQQEIIKNLWNQGEINEIFD